MAVDAGFPFPPSFPPPFFPLSFRACDARLDVGQRAWWVGHSIFLPLSFFFQVAAVMAELVKLIVRESFYDDS